MTPAAEPLTSNVRDVALIYEGGGMRASYTSAVVVALLGEGIYFDWVAGISAGSSNTANYVSRDAHRARKSFVEFVADPRFGDWRTFVRGRGLFHAEYIYEHTGHAEGALPFDFATFTANPARVRVGAFNLDRGRIHYWNESDLRPMPALMRRVRASSTMPVLMPAVHIDGELWVDGALGPTGGIAIDAAEADGFDRFFVVLTQERSYVKRSARFPAAWRTWFRRYPTAAEAILTRHRRYNETRERLFDLERDGKALLFVPDEMPVGNGERNIAKLAASHAAGLAQSRRELPRWREFLGL